MKKINLFFIFLLNFYCLETICSNFSDSHSKEMFYVDLMMGLVVGVSLSIMGCEIKELYDLNIEKEKSNIEKEKFNIDNYKISLENKELFDLFEKLKKDLDAPANVSLCVIDMESYQKNTNYSLDMDVHGFCKTRTKTLGSTIISQETIVCVSYNFLLNATRLDLTAILVHELEHARQNAKFFGSYHGEDPFYKEHGADQAVANYFKCSDCLEEIREKAKNKPSEKGYFAPEEYTPYIQEAQQRNNFCLDHKPLCTIDSEKIASSLSLFNV